MGHHITGIIGRKDLLEGFCDRGPRLRAIELSLGLAWMPITAAIADEMCATQKREFEVVDDAFAYFGSVVADLMNEMSEQGPVAYVETDYFGGTPSSLGGGRGQIATVISDKQRVLVRGTVNEALRLLGVFRSTKARDEWDTIGLGDHRRIPLDLEDEDLAYWDRKPE